MKKYSNHDRGSFYIYSTIVLSTKDESNVGSPGVERISGLN